MAEAPSVRRSSIDRIPLFRDPFDVKPRRSLPRWVGRAARWLLVALLLLAALVSCRESRKPVSLADSTLIGPRLVTGPICLEEAVDVSGSMTAFTTERERAEHALFDFARRELGGDDLFSEAFFAGSAKVALRPSSLTGLASPPGVPDGIDYDSTLLAPAVDALRTARSGVPAAGSCAARALVVITDGKVADDPSVLGAAVRKGAYTRVFAVIPSATGWGRPDELTGGDLDAIRAYHFAGTGLTGRLASIFADAKPLDVIFGDIVGSLTGQQLGRSQR